MSKREYHSGKIGSFIGLIVGLIKSDLTLLDNRDFLKAHLYAQFPELSDKAVCPNCEASMLDYTLVFDALDALLVIKMAEEVERRVRSGMSFTSANQIRIPELKASHGVKCRTTQASKLGLVAQLRGKNKKRVAGTWVITERGWKALRGERVPQKVKVWRGKIEERYQEAVTIAEVFKAYVDNVGQAGRPGKKPSNDLRHDVQEYNPRQWYEFEYHTGSLFD